MWLPPPFLAHRGPSARRAQSLGIIGASEENWAGLKKTPRAG